MEIHEEWLSYADEDLQLADMALGGNLLKGAVIMHNKALKNP